MLFVLFGQFYRTRELGGKGGSSVFGEQGADTVTESNPTGARAKKRASFKARHAKNIAKGKMSAAYWADKVKW